MGVDQAGPLVTAVHLFKIVRAQTQALTTKEDLKHSSITEDYQRVMQAAREAGVSPKAVEIVRNLNRRRLRIHSNSPRPRGATTRI